MENITFEGRCPICSVPVSVEYVRSPLQFDEYVKSMVMMGLSDEEAAKNWDERGLAGTFSFATVSTDYPVHKGCEKRFEILKRRLRMGVS